jgi:hypothetical protein
MDSATNALMRLVRAPANYWAGMLLDAGIAGWLLVHAARVPQRPWMIGGTVLFLGGLCLYSLVEYVVHRWFYHHPLIARRIWSSAPSQQSASSDRTPLLRHRDR